MEGDGPVTVSVDGWWTSVPPLVNRLARRRRREANPRPKDESSPASPVRVLGCCPVLPTGLRCVHPPVSGGTPELGPHPLPPPSPPTDPSRPVPVPDPPTDKGQTHTLPPRERSLGHFQSLSVSRCFSVALYQYLSLSPSVGPSLVSLSRSLSLVCTFRLVPGSLPPRGGRPTHPSPTSLRTRLPFPLSGYRVPRGNGDRG